MEKDETIPGIVYEINNSEYELNPPQGAYFMEGNNLDLLSLHFGHDLEPELSEGIKFKVDAVIEEYAFYAETGTEPSWSCEITEVLKVEPIR